MSLLCQRDNWGNFPSAELFFSLVLTGMLYGCDVPGRISRHLGSGEVLAIAGLEGRWAGPVIPAGTACGKPSTGLMSVGAGVFSLDPFGGTTVINGTVKDGELNGSFTRLGGNKQSLAITFSGRSHREQDGLETIDGDIVSARCRWSIVLRRA